ncbi:MAG: TRAP transporter substrate-binding protein DctP [Rubrivivax sp.]
MLSTPLRSITAATLLLAAGWAHADLGEDWLAGKVTTGNPAVTYTGAPIEFKYSHPSPPASVLVPPLQANLKRIAAASNGKLVIKEYGSGSLFGAKDGFKGVRTGVGEWGVCYPTYEGRSMPLSRVWEQPFVTPSNPMVATRIAQELASKYFVPEFRKQGVAWGMHVAFQPADILSKKPIRRIEDLQGLKVGAQGMSPDVAKALGVALVNLPYPELYTALQQGVIDAVFWVDAGFVPFKLHEVAKFHTALGLTGGGAWTCYNPEAVGKLPADLRQLYLRGLEPFAMVSTKISGVDFSVKAREAYKAAGVEMITLAPAEMQRFRDKLQPVVDAWAEDLEKDKMPAKALLKDIQALTAKYQGLSPEELMKLSIENPVAVQQ